MRNLVALTLLLAACSHNTIAGTNIPDEPQTRAVLEVLNKYKEGMEERNASAVLALTAPDYYDTSRVNRPIDYAALQRELPVDLGKLTGVRLELTIKDVKVDGPKANVDYFQVLRYAVKLPDGSEKWEPVQSDDARMKFERADGVWKIAAGL
jgi:hypothetical protein